jgi:hypothetical protein
MSGSDLNGLAAREALPTDAKPKKDIPVLSRKLWVAVIPLAFLLLASTVLFALDKLSETALIDLWKWSAVMVGLYTGGNVMSKGLDVLKIFKSKP